MILFPCCKINLGLNVVGKRPDGYHDIETVFYPVPLCDALEVTEMDAQFPSPYDCDLKVTGNAVTAERMKDNMDIDVSGIVSGTLSIRDAGERILGEVLEVASGRVTKAESYGFSDIAVDHVCRFI